MKKLAKSRLLSMVLISLFLINILNNLFSSTAKADTSDITFKIEETVDKGEVYSGEEFIYTIKYSNPNTTVDAKNVVITDELPSNIQYVSNTPSADIESVNTTKINGHDVVTFKFKEPMKAGVSGFVKITAKFPEGITIGGSSNVAINTASIKGDNGLEVTSNEVTVTPMVKAPDWNITKTKIIPQGTPAVDQPVTYRITLSGNSKIGGLNLHDVSIIDTIPVGSLYVSSSNAGSIVDNKVTWNIGNVTTGDSVSRTVTVKYPSATFKNGDLVTNIADGYIQLFGETTQLTKQVTTSHSFVDAVASVGTFTKGSRQADDRYSVGQTAQFNLSGIENTGNVPLDSIEIIDNIPSEITLTSISTGKYSDAAKIEVQYDIDGKNSWSPWPGSPFVSTINQSLNVGDITPTPSGKITGVKWIITNGAEGIASGFKDVEAISVNGTVAKPNVGNTITNNSSLSAVYAGSPILPAQTASKIISVIDPMPWIIPEKTVKNGQVKFNMKDIVEYHLRIKNHGYATGDYVNPIAIDVVPAEMENVQLGDITWNQGNSNISSSPVVDVNGTKIINGVSHQIIKWNFTGNLEPGQYVDITYTAKIKDQTLAGTVTNKFYITTDNGSNFENPPAELLNDDNDLDGDLDSSDKLVQSNRDIFVNFTGSLDSQKWVKGELDTDWGYYSINVGFGKTLPGGVADYQLKVKNIGSNGPISNIVVIDVLPYIGDTGVIDGKPRDTDWRPYLVNNITEANGVPLRAGIKVYYSTNPSPSKQELSNPIINKGLPGDGWSETPPEDITSVRTLKFDFGSGIVLQKNEEITLEWPMRAPYEAPQSKIAWNSFGYGATYPDTSGQEAFLPSEPKKVGFEVQLDPTAKYYIGNFVWEDMNKDGIQSFGELGINGILVKLYKDINNGVGLPSYVDTYRYTRTGNSHSGEAGYYEFPNLAPGKYKVKFIFPKEYKVTPYKQGSDREMDSNLEWADFTDLNNKLVDYTDNAIVKSALNSDEIVLNDKNDFSIDTGLYRLASLGDFVWDDRNANGIQDAGEPGINNAKVELLNEDGITPATYADGTVVPITHTNVAGEYKFINLEPGKYKVRFTSLNGDYKFSDSNNASDNIDNDAIYDNNAPLTTATTEAVTLKSGESNMTVDAGMYLAQIGDFVWHDKNANGKQEVGETGIPGVTVKLTDSLGNAVTDEYGQNIGTKTTDSNGMYLFEELKPGTYKVEFTKPSGYDKFSPQDVAINSTTDVNDSDADRSTGITGDIVIAAGDRNTTVDAGFYKFASIGDKVWNDKNGNGIQDTGTYNELGISGVTVNLYKSDGTAVGTTSTDSSGNYTFSGLDPGNYYVEFINPSDYVFSIKDASSNSKDSIDSDADTTSGKTVITILTSGENDTTWDAGLHKGYIGNYVWEDKDANGKQDDGSVGINGVTVNLYDSTGINLLKTFITKAGPDGNAGYYEFTDLDPAGYYVEVVKPTDYVITDANQGTDDKLDSDIDSSGRTSVINLAKGQIDDTWDSGMWKPASIGDYLWEDKNGNGVQDAGELGINGAAVSLYKQGNTNPIKTMPTADNAGIAGYYLFDNLTPGNYSLKFDMPSGFDAFTFINKGTGVNQDKLDSDVDSVGVTAVTNLISDEKDTTWDAGVYKYVTIGDKVWRDTDMNGTQDSGEPGLGNVTVNLYIYNGSSYVSKAFTTTDGSGNYLFDKSFKLEPGQYKVEFVKPSGYSFTNVNVGADNGIDSDASIVDGKTTAITLISGQTDLIWDAGLYKLATVGDFVWNDKNANGIQEPGEPGVSGVIVQLFDKNSNLINTTTTGVLGAYSFNNIVPGDYYLKFAVPAHYALSGKDQGGDDLKDSDVDTTTIKTIVITLTEGEDDLSWDMGIYKLSSIGDYVFEDMNADGIQDGGDKPLANFTVRLLDSNDNVIKATITDGSGKYLFDDLNNGDYSVQFVNNGYVFSPQIAGGNVNLDSNANSSGKTDKITLGIDEHLTDIDAGLYKLASIGDYVWLDKNDDGKQDAIEPGIAGITVKLLDKNGVEVGTTTTDATGKYSFINLVPEDYFLEFISNKDFYKHTDANNGDDSKDSDADKVTGKTAKITVKSGDINLSIDAGFTVKTGITIEKTVYAGHDGGKSTGTELVIGEKGTLLTYLFKVTNSGDTYLNNVEIQDTTLGIDESKMIKISGVEPLAPGASLLYYYEASVNGDLTNTANTTGTPSDDSGTTVPNIDKPAALDTAKVDEIKPGIDVQKVIYFGKYNSGTSGDEAASGKNGEWVTYAFTVTNTGDTYLNSLVVNDITLGIDKSKMTIISGVEPLAPGAKIHYYYETQINGDLTNTVTVTGTPSDGAGNILPNTKKPEDQDTANAKALGSIGDYLWYDNNGDEKQDSGESSLSGVKLNLLDNVGKVVATTTTDSNGKYIFDRLIPGEYAVVVDATTLPNGLKRTYELDGNSDGSVKVTLAPGQEIDTVDFGYYKLGVIGNYVWGDINGNGIQDGTEKGIKDVTVKLYKTDGTSVNTTTTDVNGLYKFDNLVLGDYYIQFVKPAGFEISQINSIGDKTIDSDAASDGKTGSIKVIAGTDDMTWDVGLYVPATIGDYLWYDNNRDGKQDLLELSLPGVKLNLLDNAGKVIATKTTDLNGKYVFDKLIPGEYTVVVDTATLPSGLNQTYELDGSKDGKVKVILTPGQVVDTVDFGYYKIHVIQLGVIGNFVWEDINENGIQDLGEQGIKDVVVKIYKDNGTIVNTTTTDVNGLYKFENLELGDYYIEFIKPVGYTITFKNTTTVKELDNNADVNGKTENINVIDGTNDMSWDAGMYKLSSVGDYVWHDINGDGIQTSNEKGIPDVKVILTDVRGNVTTTITDNAGKYIFENLVSGSYTVSIDKTTLPKDFKEAYELDKILDGRVDITLFGGQFKADVDFGYNKNGVGIDDDTVPGGASDLKASLGDYVWYDANGNEKQELNEKGIAGVKIILTDSQGTYRTTTTDDLGRYIFENLPLGKYTVTIDKTTLPKGMKETYELDKTFDGRVEVTLNTTEFKNDVDFAYNKNGIGIDDEDIPEGSGDIRTSVGDYVWCDKNGNGKQDSKEKGIAGVKLILTDFYGNEMTTTTDSIGKYIFEDIPLAKYTITIDKTTLPKGMKETYELDKDLNGKVEVTLITAEFKDDVDFGYNKSGVGVDDDKIPASPSNQDVNNLPKTGTENYNLLLSGIFMLLASTGFILFYRRKEN